MKVSAAPMHVCVIGAGNGGLAVAGSVALRGSTVALHDIRPEALAAPELQGGIYMRGLLKGLAPVKLVTMDPAEAVRGADLIIVVVPGPDQGAAARSIAPHLRPGQIVLVMPGCTGGALEVAAILGATGSRGVLVAEADAFVFACSRPEPGASMINAIKETFRVAAFPAAGTSRAMEAIRIVLPQARPAPSVLDTSLTNINAVLHVAPMVANAGRIEHLSGAFEFYGEGITPSVARLVGAYDRERLAVAAALGVDVPSVEAWIDQAYGVRERDLYRTIQVLNHDVYKTSRAPATLHSRYLEEDVPCGTVPIASLGRSIGVEVPLHLRLVQLASLLCGRDFWASGRTTETLGLAGLGADGIKRAVEGG